MTDRTIVPASKFAKNFGIYRDVATSGKTVLVQSHSRVVGGYLSKEKLDYYEALERRDRQVHVVGDLPDDLVSAIEAAEYGKPARQAFPTRFPAPSSDKKALLSHAERFAHLLDRLSLPLAFGSITA